MLQTVRLAHQPTSARRLLSAGGTAYALRHFCLPSANCLAQLLDQHLQRINLFALWQQVFNEEPRHLAYGNLLDRFLRRVNQTRFPLDEEAIQVTFDEHDDILALSIPYHSYGVPWETESIEDLQWWAQPVAAVAPVISELEGEELGWLIDRDLQPPGYTFIERESGRWPLLREALSCQEPPLDGLAVVVDCMLKCDDNCFVDDPPVLCGREEYLGSFSEYFWTELNVEMLYTQYRQVEAKIARLHAYVDWARRAGSDQHVVALLTRLVDEPWHVEECAGAYKKVVFDAR